MLLIYTPILTPRFQYIVDFFNAELFSTPIRITDNQSVYFEEKGPRLNYSSSECSDEEFFLQPAGLLQEKGIQQQHIECFEVDFLKVFYATAGDLPFDIFAASFYLLSRYEEYYPGKADVYGRYDHKRSLAYKENFLQHPLINHWLVLFRKKLKEKFPELIFRHSNFSYLQTYDIDIAYAYKHKGLARTMAAFGRDVLNGNFAEVAQRWKVLTGRNRDPYDCYEWLDALHLYCRVHPVYFFLVARQVSRYDRNTPTSNKSFQKLIEYCSGTYKTGLHPSWRSGDVPALLPEEKGWLEVVADKEISMVRMHYIRFSLPQTYRNLIGIGITEDYSMGYGTINGFRASVCSPFYWYDLEKEMSTSLRLFPFCFMDANAYYEQHLKAQQAYQELTGFYEEVKKLNGLMISIWHNNILGTRPEFADWRQVFETFMRETVYWDAYSDLA